MWGFCHVLELCIDTFNVHEWFSTVVVILWKNRWRILLYLDNFATLLLCWRWKTLRSNSLRCNLRLLYYHCLRTDLWECENRMHIISPSCCRLVIYKIFFIRVLPYWWSSSFQEESFCTLEGFWSDLLWYVKLGWCLGSHYTLLKASVESILFPLSICLEKRYDRRLFTEHAVSIRWR